MIYFEPSIFAVKIAVLTLVFIRDVVLSFSVDQQGGQKDRLVQLILQVDVVVA